MTIEKRLKEERERLGVTQPAFAEVAGVVKQTVIQWEKGASGPSAAQLSALHEIGVDLQYVLLGIRSPKVPLRAGITLHEVIEEVLTPDEAALLDNYRHCSVEGKNAVKTTVSCLAQSGKGVKKGKAA